jgi:UDP-GlcNAc:undecaprenyl-phosphate/decaprenyl-phosphate GlcNAc-1-phosphate transferase
VVTGFLVALVVTVAATGPLITALRRRGLLDVPNSRSSHTAAVPRGGGLAVLAGLVVGAATGLVVSADDWHGVAGVVTTMALAVALLAALGLTDDVRGLTARVRLTVQVVIAVAASVSLVSSDAPTSPVLALLGVIVWLVGYVNAFNFMDGINGISAVMAVLSSGWYALLAAEAHDVAMGVVASALAGASLGFLPWNAPRARVFLGDVGSYGIGATLALLGAVTALRDDNLWWAIAPALLYVADTGYTLVRRAVSLQPLTEAHRGHVYQRLVASGLSHTASVGVVCACTLVILVLARLLPTAIAAPASILVCSGYLALPGVLARSPHEATR